MTRRAPPRRTREDAVMTAKPEPPSFTIPKDMIQPAIDAAVSAAVVASFGAGDQMIATAVSSVLTEQVDSEGKPSRSYGHSRTKKTRVDYLVTKCVSEACELAINDYLASHQELVRGQIERELANPRSRLAKGIVTALTSAITESRIQYRMKVTAEIREPGWDTP